LLLATRQKKIAPPPEKDKDLERVRADRLAKLAREKAAKAELKLW